MKKRILFTVSNDLNYDQRMQRICTTLQREGYDVTLVGRAKKSSIPLAKTSYKQKRIDLAFEKGKLFYIELNIRLFFLLLFQPFDIVCGVDLDTILPCYLISRLKSKKCVLDAHELFTEVPEVINRPAVRRAWLAVEKFICKRVKYAYTVSQSVADEFKKRYSISFDVIRNMPYKLQANELPSKKLPETLILYQGAVNKGRGLEAAIEAMKNIDGKLLIAGDGDILEDVKALTSRLGLFNKISFTGYITPEQLHHVTLGATVGLNLLEATSKNYYFSLANKFLDYIQCRLPQVSMNFPEYERINTKYRVAVLIDKTTPENIAHAVNMLLTNLKLKDELVLNCTRASEELYWEVEERKLIDFYKPL